jgi:hypothetical protein
MGAQSWREITSGSTRTKKRLNTTVLEVFPDRGTDIQFSAAVETAEAWKVKLSLCLINHHAMKTYGGVGV